MRDKLILVAEKTVKKEIEKVMEQINNLLANRLESVWDEPEQEWITKVTSNSKIKEGLQTIVHDESVNNMLSTVANHAKSLMYIELKNLQQKFKEVSRQERTDD